MGRGKQMGKKKQSKVVKGILFIAGILFICASLYFLVHGISTYIQQLDQKDWSITTATVINIEERRKSIGGRHKRRHYTVYDIYYQYEAEGNSYTDVIYGVNAGKKYGDNFPIKYDPEAPQNSTHYLEPTLGIIVSGVFGFLTFGGSGLHMIRSTLPKRKKSSSHNRKK